MRRAAFTAVLLLVIALCVPLMAAAAAHTGTAAPAAQTSVDRLSTLTTISVRNADVRNVLTDVFSAMKADFVIADDVTGQISLSVRDLSAAEVLDRICAAKGLHWWVSGDTYMVSAHPKPADARRPGAASAPVLAQPAGDKKRRTHQCAYVHCRDLASLFNSTVIPTPEGRIWRLSLSGVFGDPTSNQRGMSGASSDGMPDTTLRPFTAGSSRLGESSQMGMMGGGMMGSGMMGGGMGILQSGGGLGSVGQLNQRLGTSRIGGGRTGVSALGNQPLTEREMEMFESGIDITAPFAALLPEGMTAPVAYEPLNYLIFEATDEAYDRFLELIRIFDQKPKQVLLEVQFVTMNTIDARGLGLDWFWNAGRTSMSVTGLDPGGYAVLKFAKGRNLAASLSALLTSNKARIVNAPRIATMNNFPASIDFEQDIPYVNFSGSTVVANVGTVAGGATVEVVTIPTTLDVLPRINGDDSVTVLLNPQIASFTLVEVPIPGGGTQNFPQVTTQSLYTLLNIKNEETMVIGGFIARTEVNNTSKVPLLGELPIVGQLFRSVNKSTNDSELLIFVTPHVMKDEFTAGTNMTF